MMMKVFLHGVLVDFVFAQRVPAFADVFIKTSVSQLKKVWIGLSLLCDSLYYVTASEIILSMLRVDLFQNICTMPTDVYLQFAPNQSK